MIQSDEITLPAEFQISLYENLIRQLGKQGGFQHFYRDGDRNAANAGHSVPPPTAAASQFPARSTNSASSCSVSFPARLSPG